jgi:glutaredoxin
MKRISIIFLLLMALVSGCVQDHEKPLKPVMYGSYSCPHCIEQKTLINASDYDYVECSINNKLVSDKCLDANIRVFPTWIFPNGQRIEGVIDKQKFEALNDSLHTR